MIEELSSFLDAADTIPRHKSGKAQKHCNVPGWG
jgi:hypothetical protein